MNIHEFPERTAWDNILARPDQGDPMMEKNVSLILEEIKKDGDKALHKYTSHLDGVELEDFRVSKEQIQNAGTAIDEELKAAIEVARKNISTFHGTQLQNFDQVETSAGVTCWRQQVPIEKVGLYIPGGSAPLFSTVLMLGIPASLAGCKRIVLITPPDKAGNVHPAILYTAHLLGIEEIYRIGGAQAIGAMAYGTESIPRVDKLFGPGNQYVTLAKQLINKEGIAIDLPAGPSEVLVLADETANPEFVAADLLSQAEHGPDSQVILVTVDRKILNGVEKALNEQVQRIERRSIATAALENSQLILLSDIDEALDLINLYGPEHLIASIADEERVIRGVRNAGSVFLGHYSPEAAGDYASGTNHTLPTNGAAKAYSGVSVDSFMKLITYQRLTRSGLAELAPVIGVMAEAEDLEAHKEAIRIRNTQE